MARLVMGRGPSSIPAINMANDAAENRIAARALFSAYALAKGYEWIVLVGDGVDESDLDRDPATTAYADAPEGKEWDRLISDNIKWTESVDGREQVPGAALAAIATGGSEGGLPDGCGGDPPVTFTGAPSTATADTSGGGSG